MITDLDHRYLYMGYWRVDPPPEHPNCRCTVNANDFWREFYG